MWCFICVHRTLQHDEDAPIYNLQEVWHTAAAQHVSDPRLAERTKKTLKCLKQLRKNSQVLTVQSYFQQQVFFTGTVHEWLINSWLSEPTHGEIWTNMATVGQRPSKHTGRKPADLSKCCWTVETKIMSNTTGNLNKSEAFPEETTSRLWGTFTSVFFIFYYGHSRNLCSATWLSTRQHDKL